MILVINVCREELHYFEFVRPVEDILSQNKIKFLTKHYLELKKSDLEACEKVIICGTSLADNEFAENASAFSWIRDIRKPILGICAGMQIVALTFKSKLNKKTEIGFFKEKFDREFLGLTGEQEVYHLHNSYASQWGKEWEICCRGNGIVQAVKNKKKQIYACLFHPEVRNKEAILEFVRE